MFTLYICRYVPALRQLRQSALIVTFPQTDPTKLASRLYEVARLERLKSDMNALLALCEKTDNDIRSCLNTLQVRLTTTSAHVSTRYR